MQFSKKNSSEFYIVLQPKLNLATNQISGAEALVRRYDKVNGIVAPDLFIPEFEDNGSIIELDRHVLDLTCRSLKDMEKKNYPLLPISVNLSQRHMSIPGTCDILCGIVDKHHVDHSLITFEITESTACDNGNLFHDVVLNMKSKGFLVALDDFGSGHSCLSILSEIPVDIIKLDRSFLRDFDGSEGKSAAVIESVINLCKKIGAQITCEGVETQDQMDFVRASGCHEIQGYFISPPVPVGIYKSLILSPLDDDNDDDEDIPEGAAKSF